MSLDILNMNKEKKEGSSQNRIRQLDAVKEVNENQEKDFRDEMNDRIIKKDFKLLEIKKAFLE